MEPRTPQADDETVRVEVAEIRRILHLYNNLAAQLLTKSELALLSDDPAAREETLRRVGEIAEQMGRVTREARRTLLGDER